MKIFNCQFHFFKTLFIDANDSKLLLKVNAIQNILIRFAVFNQSISSEIVPVIGTLLNTTGQPEVIKTSIACLGDICKK